MIKRLFLPLSLLALVLYVALSYSPGMVVEHRLTGALNNMPGAPSDLSPSPTHQGDFNISAFSVLDKNNLWAVAHEGGDVVLTRSVILHSSDGGRSLQRQMVTDWESDTASPSHYIWDIHFINSEVGWVSGSSGLIFKSTDGGDNWTKQRAPTEASLEKIQFLNAERGWIMGQDGRGEAVILHTEDGGLNWRSRPLDLKGWLNSISFGDRYNGWVVGEKGQAYQSTDAGAS
jgi:photosystem II stability/assembly factor-like uncharacterized protein